MTEIVRLYVSPFNQETSTSIWPAALKSSSPSTSFHTIATCAESSFGYVEVPSKEAEKLKKKLNGSILKGKKMKVENARPPKRGYVPDVESGEPESSPPDQNHRSTRSKRARSQLEGHELSPEREIKRGWTKPGKEARAKSPKGKTPSKSKYTDKKECLFRTQLPANKESNGLGKEADTQENDKKKSKKPKKSETIVHEFEKSTTQPAFIKPRARSQKTGPSAEYIDGKGWVDQDGNFVEKGPQGSPRRRSTRGAAQASTAASTSTSEGESSEDNSENKSSELNPEKPPASSSNTSLTDAQQNKLLPPPIPIIKTTEVDAVEGSEAVIETDEASQAMPHPLETLFKRPKQAASQTANKRSLEIKTTFNFFEPDQPEKPGVPQTPFTTRDLHQRGMRSAAPTPDTALPTRRFFPESSSPESDGPSDSEVKSPSKKDGKLPAGLEEEKGESEFSQWFWENRGDNNRAWKKRRREAKKETRQQDNRQRSRRKK